VLASRAWLGTVLDGIREGVMATGVDGRVRFLNPVAEELTGWPLDEALDRPLEEIYRLTDLEGRAIEPVPLRAALDQRRSQDKELYLLHRRDGIEIAIEDLSAPFTAGDDGTARGAVTVFSDVSERLREVSSSHEERQRLESRAERAVHALGESRAELRALAANLLRAREEEGQRIARELHDDFSQRLALVAIEAETLRRQVPTDELRAGLDRIIERSEQVAADLRALSHRMHPSVLADLGLVDALRALVVESQIELVEIEFDETPEDAPIPMSTSIALYRIAQEALRNVIKHAPRARVTMRLAVADDEIRLEIEDDGPGFELAEARRRGAGMGLISIHERARLAGGRLEVDSAPGAGTRIRVAVPADGDD
jgi:PAS domain S-box-containing protein